MFVKIFTSILDGSLATDYQTRLVFEDMLKLCDVDGVVDMTAVAISGRTGVPIEIVRKGIAKLEQPDPESRTPDFEGRRIIRIDEHRDWGWMVVNYSKYRAIESAEQRRSKTRERVARFRERRKAEVVTPSDGLVTLGNAGNGMQRQMEKKKEEASTRVPPAGEGELGLAAPDNDVNRSPKAAIPGAAAFTAPYWDDVLAWMKEVNSGPYGAGFTEVEVRQAFVTLGERGWTRTTAQGEVKTHDWRLSIEKQIGYGRERKESNANHGPRASGKNHGTADKPLRSRHIMRPGDGSENQPTVKHYPGSEKLAARVAAMFPVAAKAHPDGGDAP